MDNPPMKQLPSRPPTTVSAAPSMHPALGSVSYSASSDGLPFLSWSIRFGTRFIKPPLSAVERVVRL